MPRLILFGWILVVLLLSTSMISSVAAAQHLCPLRSDVTAHLKEKYNERQIATGVSEDGGKVLEVWVSPTGGTWTILVTSTDGLSCMAASGRNWSAPVAVELETSTDEQ